jgi:hypothetical protein
MKHRVSRKSQRAPLSAEALDERQLLSTGIAFVGLAKAPASEMTYLASQFKPVTGEVDVSFLPFEYNPSNPFGNATTLAQGTLLKGAGTLGMTVDLKWFVHDSGINGKLSDGTSADTFGRPASQTFWNDWAAYNPKVQLQQQPQPIQQFLGRVHTADAWVQQTRTWAAGNKAQGKLAITYVPVLEDECTSVNAYKNLVGAIQAQEAADGVGNIQLRRSMSGDHSTSFRVDGVSMELHGPWSRVSGSLQKGDTWSNDGTHYDGTRNADGSVYSITEFVSSGGAAKNAKVNVLYWNSDYNGIPHDDQHVTNWATRTVNPFSGPDAAANKARLTQVLGI